MYCQRPAHKCEPDTHLAHLGVPARIVVNIDNARRARVQTRLHERIVLDKVVLVDRAAEDAVGEELPADGEAEDVEAVVVDKVLQLALAVFPVVLRERRPRSARAARPVRGAPKVEPGDVHSREAHLAGAGGGDLAAGFRGWGGDRGGCGGRRDALRVRCDELSENE